jgi:hypothetical protein
MSMTPNNPFDDPQRNQMAAQGPPAAKSRKGCLLGCGIAAALSLLLCCGGGLVLTQFTFSMIASEYQRELAGNPVIVEHIGEIQSLDVSWGGIFEEAQKAGEQGGQGSLVFDVEGSKGSGRIVVEPDQGQAGGGGDLGAGTLIMPDGNRYPLDPSAGPAGIEELELQMNDLFDPGQRETTSEPAESTSADPN